jgi:hypothetical protein
MNINCNCYPLEHFRFYYMQYDRANMVSNSRGMHLSNMHVTVRENIILLEWFFLLEQRTQKVYFGVCVECMFYSLWLWRITKLWLETRKSGRKEFGLSGTGWGIAVLMGAEVWDKRNLSEPRQNEQRVGTKALTLKGSVVNALELCSLPTHCIPWPCKAPETNSTFVLAALTSRYL